MLGTKEPAEPLQIDLDIFCAEPAEAYSRDR